MAINCLGKTKRWSEAIKVFERMPTELGHKPDGMTYGVVINALAVVSAFVCMSYSTGILFFFTIRLL